MLPIPKQYMVTDVPASHHLALPLRHSPGFRPPDRWPVPRCQKCHGVERGLRLSSDCSPLLTAESRRSDRTTGRRKSALPERASKPSGDLAFSKPLSETLSSDSTQRLCSCIEL